MRTLIVPALAALAACNTSTTKASTPLSPEPTTTTMTTTTTSPTGCPAEHCITIDNDGAIDQPFLNVTAGEPIQFELGNRWQSIIEISSDTPTACDDNQLEVPYVVGQQLTGPMPELAGGVIVRGSPDATFRFPDAVWESDAVSGVLLVIPWRELEPLEGQYDFSVFTDALEQATRYGKLVSIGLQAGARAPRWMYSPYGVVPGNEMVTKATSGEKCFDQLHPNFWDPNYVDVLTAFQTALSDELKAHAGAYRHVDKIKISGVNLMTAETRMPVDREEFCGFQDAVCSNGPAAPTACKKGTCPISGCTCVEDPVDKVEKCGRYTDDLPQVWADAGYRPSLLEDYFVDLFAEQQLLFPEKDINLMEIARAFPNVSDSTGTVQGFADPTDVRRLIDLGIQEVPDRFVVLNAALNGDNSPQEICLTAADRGAPQIGFQTQAMGTWSETEPALQNAVDAVTPGGLTEAVSFVEIYIAPFMKADTVALQDFDTILRERIEPAEPLVHTVNGLDSGTYYYKIGGTDMTSGQCHIGTLEVSP